MENELKKTENNFDKIDTIDESLNDNDIVYGEVFDFQKKRYKIDVKGIANNLVQIFDFSQILGNISADKEYVVVIPKEFRQGLEKGKNWFMQNKDNPNLLRPNIMEINDDGKHVVAKQLGIKEKLVTNGSPVNALADKCQNAYLQGQMQRVAQLLEDTIEYVKNIEQGQDSDRIGMLNSGKELLYLAMSSNNENSKALMQNAITNISISKEQMLDVFKGRVEGFENIPKSKVKQFLNVFFSVRSDYLTQCDNEYNRIQRYYDYITEATQLMATGFLYIGDLESAKNVYDITLAELKNIDYSKVKTVKYIGDGYKGICDDAVEQLEKEKTLCLEQKNNNDQLIIEISGKTLLEELKDD